MSECQHSFIKMQLGAWCTKCQEYLSEKEYAEYMAKQEKPKRKPKQEKTE